jgi:DNA-binding transcriptional ArsR family regulator
MGEKTSKASVVRAARLIGNDARAAMLLLLERRGEASTRDLAAVANLSIPAATYHLGALIAAGVVRADRQGRLVIHRLASPSVSAALRVLAAMELKETSPTPVDAPEPPEWSARTCYRHLGGRLAIALMDSLRRKRWIGEGIEGWHVTVRGSRELRALGVDLRQFGDDPRPHIRLCMDRTERRHHLGGRLGIRLADRLFALGWIQRVPQSRAVTITEAGRRGFQEIYGLEDPAEGLGAGSLSRARRSAPT